ncbi:hypothetical protein BLA60_15205 [Actinophytocola xinjiangensis]|uniref:Carrier domain-containing protein n=1 Tax=Actinophytocola xinjiangensis TaxID=485602 RepID=A0A7Z0WNP1_9PSEU|nr:condensation domain-containing protein [Actinophytocola xinjiangensis]OLF10529.1 hypothetical protein BLA60_15205 [Actinophytocola xinjiangensis]
MSDHQPGAVVRPIVTTGGPLEKKVEAIWSEVLQREHVGPHEDFFDLGGQSLLAARLAERLRDEFGVHFSVRELYGGSTIADITRVLSDRTTTTAEDPDQPIPVLPRRSGGPVLPSVPGEQWFPAAVSQVGMWRGIAAKGGPALAITSGLRIRGVLDPELVEVAWNAVIARHETLRTALVDRDGQLTQVIAEEVHDRVPVTPVRALAEFDDAARHEVDRPFPLARRPLARLRLFRLAEDDHIALLLTHHIISDARTLEVLVRDLAAGYAAAATGTPVPLPPLPVRWVEFAARHRERLTGPRGAELRRYWAQRLAGVVPVDLPSDVEPPPDQDAHDAQRGDTLVTALTPTTFQLLSELVRTYRVTSHVVGLVALTVVLARRSRQRDIAVDVPVSFRDHSQLDDVVADFSNDVIVRSDLSADPTLAELIDATRGRLADDFAHHDLPPFLLAEHLGEQGLMDRLAEALFTAEHDPEVAPQLGPLRLEPLHPPRQYVTRPLSVRLRHNDSGGRLIVRYRTNRFTARRIAELVHDYLDLFREMAHHPEHRVFADSVRDVG